MRKTHMFLAVCFFASAALVSCSSKENPGDASNNNNNNNNTTVVDSTTLSAFKLTSDADAPDYNSSAVESIWNNAKPLVVTASAIGDNFTGASFPVTIKSVVSSDN